MISSPATVMVPRVGTSKPPSKFSSVVFPEPLGPMNATKSPLSTSRFNPCRTRISPPPRWYVLSRPRTRIRLSGRSAAIHSDHHSLLFLDATLCPSRRSGGPLTITVSPGARPPMISVFPPAVFPTVTASAFGVIVLYAETRSSCRRRPERRSPGPKLPPPGHRGPFALCFSSPRNVTLTPISGRIRGSNFRKEMRTLTVAFWRSAEGITVRTRLGICQSG